MRKKGRETAHHAFLLVWYRAAVTRMPMDSTTVDKHVTAFCCKAHGCISKSDRGAHSIKMI